MLEEIEKWIQTQMRLDDCVLRTNDIILIFMNVYFYINHIILRNCIARNIHIRFPLFCTLQILSPCQRQKILDLYWIVIEPFVYKTSVVSLSARPFSFYFQRSNSGPTTINKRIDNCKYSSVIIVQNTIIFKYAVVTLDIHCLWRNSHC